MSPTEEQLVAERLAQFEQAATPEQRYDALIVPPIEVDWLKVPEQ